MNEFTKAVTYSDLDNFEEHQETVHEHYEKRRKYQEAEKSKRRTYFFEQKLVGVLMLLVTIIMVKALDGDLTLACITVPISLYLIFSKEMIFINKYFLKNKKENNK